MLQRVLTTVVFSALALAALDRSEARSGWPTPGSRVHLHAHNCYPDRGRWADRIDRALSSGVPHLAVEQDLVWQPPTDGRPGRSVVSHDAPALGDEPSLEEHFFERVRPMLDEALTERRESRWPLLVLHLDFKTNEPEHHRYIWELLGRYERWLTTAELTADETVSSLVAGPLLVLTENGPGQEEAFHRAHPRGTRLRLFGTVPPAAAALPREADARAEAIAAIEPALLIPSAATSYRRWTNHAWAVIEAGGPNAAGEWTSRDHARLREVVSRAHDMGLWVRFYGLNGHEAPGDGWSAGYNFGSPGSVEERWRAAIDARVDFVATDQYEAFAEQLAWSVARLLPAVRGPHASTPRR